MRIASFIDGFTSASAPLVTGGSQENYSILNNQPTAQTLLTIDGAAYKSVFIDYELEREETGASFRQVGTIILSLIDSVWVLNLGNYQGDDLIQDTLSLDEHITLSITTASEVGSLKYTSGNMSTVYVGNLKMFITRIATV